MKKTMLILGVLVVMATPLHAIIVTLFMDVDTLIRRSHDIVIAKCVSAPTNAPWAFEDGFYPARMDLMESLKGERKPGPFTTGTIYPLAEGKTYLLCNSGGSAFGSDFLCVAELSVVGLPASFRLALLAGRHLKEQLMMIFTSRQTEIDRNLRELQRERALLAKALGKEKEDSEPGVGR